MLDSCSRTQIRCTHPEPNDQRHISLEWLHLNSLHYTVQWLLISLCEWFPVYTTINRVRLHKTTSSKQTSNLKSFESILGSFYKRLCECYLCNSYNVEHETFSNISKFLCRWSCDGPGRQSANHSWLCRLPPNNGILWDVFVFDLCLGAIGSGSAYMWWVTTTKRKKTRTSNCCDFCMLRQYHIGLLLNDCKWLHHDDCKYSYYIPTEYNVFWAHVLIHTFSYY